MPVTSTPVAGKFIVRAGPADAKFPRYLPGGRIVRVSGQRVYYMEGTIERFTHNVELVCDTEDEAKAILAFSTQEANSFQDYMAGYAHRKAALLQSFEDPPMPRTRARRAKA